MPYFFLFSWAKIKAEQQVDQIDVLDTVLGMVEIIFFKYSSN